MTDISIIIPTYNRAERVIRAINSCLKCPTLEVEVIVVDDGSSDNTEKKISGEYWHWPGQTAHGTEFIQGNQLIKYISQVNRGAPAARNNGLARATGRYVKFLDSDDLLVDDALEKEFQAAETNQSEALLTGWIDLTLDDQGNQIDEKYVPAPDLSRGIDDMLEGKGPCASAGFYRRSSIAGLWWDESVKKAQDWMWAWTVCLAGVRFSSLDIPSSCYIQYNSAERITQTGNSLYRSTRARLDILNKVEAQIRDKQLLTTSRAKKLAKYYYKDARIVCQIDTNKWLELHERIIGLDRDFNPDDRQMLARVFNRLFGVRSGVVNLVRLKKMVNAILNRPA
jgi:glycosyltransferase involved in cell wall biosynthesis